MTVETYLEWRRKVAAAGYSSDLEWAQNVGLPVDAERFFCEYAWVVLNAGMKEQVARTIWGRIKSALHEGSPVYGAFGHEGKARAIQEGWDRQADRFAEFLAAEDRFAFLRSLPWIGPITVYHLAKNCGMDFAKPDRHLVRIATANATTWDVLCQRLAEESGDRIGTVDYVLWRAANLGWI